MVTGCCEYGDEPSGSGATELVGGYCSYCACHWTEDSRDQTRQRTIDIQGR
jgi:hypothetical protein